MTSLLKQGFAADAARDWRPEDGQSEMAAPTIDPAIAALESEIGALKRSIAETAIHHAKEVERARTEGRADALAEFVRDEAKALTALTAGIDSAVVETRERVANLDELALVLCHVALEKIFADTAGYSALVTQAIKLQVAELRRSTVLRVLVSASDFTDVEAMDALEASLGGGLQIERDPLLPSGACRIDLRLGHIELSVAEHWHALKAQLRRSAGGPL